MNDRSATLLTLARRFGEDLVHGDAIDRMSAPLPDATAYQITRYVVDQANRQGWTIAYSDPAPTRADIARHYRRGYDHGRAVGSFGEREG